MQFMEAIRKQVLYDENNVPIGVVVPIEEWNRIEAKLKPKLMGIPASRLMKHFGKMSYPGDAVEVQRQLRAEWPN